MEAFSTTAARTTLWGEMKRAEKELDTGIRPVASSMSQTQALSSSCRGIKVPPPHLIMETLKLIFSLLPVDDDDDGLFFSWCCQSVVQNSVLGGHFNKIYIFCSE